jgi:quercetin dioxygenase-like cupin family protein
MDVRVAEGQPLKLAHQSTISVWHLLSEGEMKAATRGGYLELVSVFEVNRGEQVAPHNHPKHEFYYVLNGKGMMTVGSETREISPGHLVYIPPNLVHSLTPIEGHTPIRCFAFSIGLPD